MPKRGTLRMPWGKHAGKRLDEIPMSYLEWVLQNCRNIPGRLRTAIAKQLGAEVSPVRQEVNVDIKQAIDRWFREMSLRFHRDRGGSDPQMVAVIEGHERLKALLNVR
jgi:uncharacterized protein (DUF3820 family)